MPLKYLLIIQIFSFWSVGSTHHHVGIRGNGKADFDVQSALGLPRVQAGVPYTDLHIIPVNVLSIHGKMIEKVWLRTGFILQCSTTGVTNTVVCAILSVGWCI